jgi:hypothetical protein
VFLEAQVSMRRLTFQDDGGLTRDPIDGTVLQDQTTGARWWSPSFCGICSPEHRNSNDVLVKGMYLLSTGGGAHNLSFGYDSFDDIRKGDLNQSGSDYHVWTTGTIVENGEVYPVVANDFSTWIIWWPVTAPSRGTSFRTHSVFLNDRWQSGPHWSFNLGVRLDKNQGRNAVGELVATGTMWSPRLGLVWDPSGQGRWTLNASGGRYVSALSNPIADSSSPAGIPSILAYFYEGPEINTNPDGALVTTRDALVTIFDWFNANGGVDREPFYTQLPGVDRQIRESLGVPYANELTVGGSRLLGSRGALRIDLVSREYRNFYSERVDVTTGQVENVNGEVFDVTLIENTDEVSRRYLGLHAQADYRFGGRTRVGGNYTLSRLWGTFDGENVGTGPLAAGILEYPEFFDPAWSFPEGDLAADQRHKVRLWTTYDVAFTDSLGDVTLGVLQLIESGTPYGARGSIRTAPYVDDPGYITPPDTVTYYFTPRDAFRSDTLFRTDLAVNWARPVGAGRGQVFADLHVLNLFNRFQAFNRGAINATVLTAVDDPDAFAPFNPYTETPVEGVHWGRGPQFGLPTGASAYTTPLTFRFSVGFRY